MKLNASGLESVSTQFGVNCELFAEFSASPSLELSSTLDGPGLYSVDSKGGRHKGTQFSVGSGSPYAYGVLEIEEARDLEAEARRTIST
ncbi:Proteasome subunit beta [Quillaja saponaria]|uniref:Proteasome subunit beta n=1 Tax=Quillaja saponaria TaxID=32244 RepID=A0AAD7LE17_QUISA|nr:Proteasome subunit beta [Quillaja saponaria]